MKSDIKAALNSKQGQKAAQIEVVYEKSDLYPI